MYPSWVTFAEGCTVFQLSTSESHPLPRYQQWRYLDAYKFSDILDRWRHGIGSPICCGILIHCTFSSFDDFIISATKRDIVMFFFAKFLQNCFANVLFCMDPRSALQQTEIFESEKYGRLSAERHVQHTAMT